MTRHTGPFLRVRRRIDDIETSVSALIKLGPDTAGTFLFESVIGGERRGRYSVIGVDPDVWWRVRQGVAETSDAPDFDIITHVGLDPLADMRRFVAECQLPLEDDLPPMAAGAFGYIGYDMVRYAERLGPPPQDALGLPDAILIRPRVILIFDSVKQEITLTTPVRDGDLRAADQRLDAIEQKLDQPIASAIRSDARADQPVHESNTSRARFHEMVQTAKAHIRAGEVLQVVVSQRLTVDFQLHPLSFYRALRHLNPSPFLFYVNVGDFQIIGSSPEILVRLRDGRVVVRPIAGTMPRGSNQQEDLANERTLLSDEKELAEHLMLLDLGRNDVGRVAVSGSVRVPESFATERYSHVMHIASQVEGDLRPGADAVSALMAGFPAGTVSGAPKIRAMQIIDDLESNKRGIYAGGIGYFGARGDMDICIALRTAICRRKKLHIQAGGGVVFDSDPEKEYQESLSKARALLTAAGQAVRYRMDA